MTVTVEQNVPLAPFTTIGIGGPARYFVRAVDIDVLREAIDWARDRSLPLFILGGGSNLLISDDGFDGLVIHVDLRGVTIQALDEYAMVRVAAGEVWDDFVAMAVTREWAGIECLSGIPGSVGATPIQNVGAYGQEVSETIARVEVLDRRDGLVKTLTNWECRFGYRSSLFKNYERDRYVVTAVTFRLKAGGRATIRYPELQKAVSSDDLREVRHTVLTIRKRKGMVIDPTDPDTRSDGSFFMNPIVDPSAATEEMPKFPADDGKVKLSAAWLIQHAGFEKGFILGNVGLSTKHTLALINRGGATARDVLALVELIQTRVREKFGIELHPEPNFVGIHNPEEPRDEGSGAHRRGD
ncbi:MAG TPA: UDP-N-acetylmuramate dehydrogenase [Thermoanaerobaculia bacterium]|nr:UDP-N-acetylmuramate dehydrogenase [Thermoanaerobaculia bacterium]